MTPLQQQQQQQQQSSTVGCRWVSKGACKTGQDWKPATMDGCIIDDDVKWGHRQQHLIESKSTRGQRHICNATTTMKPFQQRRGKLQALLSRDHHLHSNDYTKWLFAPWFRMFLVRVAMVQFVSVTCAQQQQGFLGIPGTRQTLSGYDSELGNDAICWTSRSSTGTNQNNTSVAFPNTLVKEFRLDGSVQLLWTCPTSNALQANAPIEQQRGERLRTGTWYTYRAMVQLNLASLGGEMVISDNAPWNQTRLYHTNSNTTVGVLENRSITEHDDFDPTIQIRPVVSIQVIVCSLGKAGFCSPFVHEESNARLAAEGITQSPARGDLHGGTHIHSPYQYVELDPNDGPVYSNITVDVPMLVNVPGDYYAIAGIMVFVNNVSSVQNLVRFDMANALMDGQRLISYQAPAVIWGVDESILITSYVAIAISAAIIGFLLLQSIKYRNHQIFLLTQGHFLILMQLAALVGTVSSFLLQPKNDIYCTAGTSILFVSLHLVGSITIGRLWRIHAVISPLLASHRVNAGRDSWATLMLNFLQNYSTGRFWTRYCCSSLGPNPSRRTSRHLRRQISSAQLAAVIGLFWAPQLIMQLLSLTLQPIHSVVQYNTDESMGLRVCSAGVPVARSIMYYAFYVFLLQWLLLLLLAHSTRSLPSLFNETNLIFDSTLSNSVILFICMAILLVSNNDPGSAASPAIQYMASVALVLSFTVNSTFRIVMPKLRMIWNGETVLVSKLVSDHSKETRRSRERQEERKQQLKEEEEAQRRRRRGHDDPSTTVGTSPNKHSLSSSIQVFNGNEMAVVSQQQSEPPLAQAEMGMAQHALHSDIGRPGTRPMIISTSSNTNDLIHEFGMDSHQDDSVDEDDEYNDDVVMEMKDDRRLTTMATTSSELDANGDSNASHSQRRSSRSFGDLLANLRQNSRSSLSASITSSQSTLRASTNATRAGTTAATIQRDSTPAIGSLQQQQQQQQQQHLATARLLQQSPSSQELPGRQRQRLSSSSRDQQQHHHPVVVRIDQTPSRRLLLRLIHMEEHLNRINRRIMSGRAASTEEWDTIRQHSIDLGQSFWTGGIQFAWETSSDDVGGANEYDSEPLLLSQQLIEKSPIGDHGPSQSSVAACHQPPPLVIDTCTTLTTVPEAVLDESLQCDSTHRDEL